MKVFTGKVIALKNIKTATVEVTRTVSHPKYSKQMRKAKKYQVHDEKGVKLGATVNFAASKPYSKTKKWRIIE